MTRVNSLFNLVKTVYLLLVLCAFQAVANSPISVSKQIVEHVKAERFEQAFRLASYHKLAWEGEPDFDLAYGLAAHSVGKLQQALFAFERVLEISPSNLNARLYVAICYFEIGNLAAAQSEFALLSTSALPASLSAQVSQYLDAINRQKSQSSGHWRNWLQLSAGHDSNPNNGIDDERIFIPRLGNVNLFDENREVSSAFHSVSGQVAYLAPLNQQDLIFVSGSVLHSNYQKSLAWSRTFVFTQVGYQTRWENYQLVASAFYRPVWLDNDEYLDYTGVQFSASKEFTNLLELGAEIVLANEHYPDRPVLDRNQYLLNIFSTYSSNWGKHTFQIKFGSEKADDKNDDFTSRDLRVIGYKWQQSLAPDWSLKLAVEWLNSEHGQANPLFNIIREDDLFRVEAQIQYQISPQWHTFVNATSLNNDSNLTIYEYARHKIWLGVRYEF